MQNINDNFIIEQALFSEAEIVRNYDNKRKAIFKTALQTYDDINQNKRKYPRNVLESGMNFRRESVEKRSFFGELDHPLPTGDQNFNIVRQTTVLLKEVCTIIRNYELSNGLLRAECETTSTENGYKFWGLLKDKAGIGYSMRGMGELEEMDGYNQVKDPLTIIAFDAVSNPSHKQAVVNLNSITFESCTLNENSNMICCDGKCYLPNYFDKLIETNQINFFKRWV